MGVDRLVEEGLAQVTWLPFELHPDIPPEGISRDEYFGPNWRSRGDGVRVMAAELGLTMKTRDRLINTRKALATAEFGRENGKFEQVHRALFEAHCRKFDNAIVCDMLGNVAELATSNIFMAKEDVVFTPIANGTG